jgi:hypothetical protein
MKISTTVHIFISLLIVSGCNTDTPQLNHNITSSNQNTISINMEFNEYYDIKSGYVIQKSSDDAIIQIILDEAKPYKQAKLIQGSANILKVEGL